MKLAAITHRGLHRTENQDRVVVDGVVLASGNTHLAEFVLGRRGLLAVIDGMGGHPAGGVAAAVAADVIASGHTRLRTPSDVEALVSAANDEIYATMGRIPGVGGMGATIAGVVVSSDTLLVFNVGDARVYLAGGGYLIQASIDDRHTGAPHGPITQSLGGLDTHTPVDVHISREPADTGRILVASDGLFAGVPHETLALVMSRPPADAARALVDEALAAGGRDNISLGLIELAGETT